ncbi:Myosin heavy chain, cardiac muscle isoform [Fukomys damarensis]|uniref:Myosin heavy chain, cardiac muscle isoform n=1 Tax=Fukomys damarensis TaxID=885580 RepID=A0A091DI95_FUKDA|nr:Myosin heavy chain, cardiac muscle isoform [Fukomys damarensis]
MCEAICVGPYPTQVPQPPADWHPHHQQTGARETLANIEEQCKLLIRSEIQLEARVKELSKCMEEEEEINSELTARGRKLRR